MAPGSGRVGSVRLLTIEVNVASSDWGKKGFPKLLIPAQAAALLGTSVRSLARWRSRGEGPAWIRLPGTNGCVRYEESAIVAWIVKQREQPGNTGG